MNKQIKKIVKPIKNNGKKEITRLKTVRYLKLLILFVVSFSVVGVGILGYHWYGVRLKADFQKKIAKFKSNKAPEKTTNALSNGVYFDPLDLVQVIKKGDTNIVLLDVRSSEEYKKEHVKRAVSVPLYFVENGLMRYLEVREALQKVKIDKSKQIVVYGPSSSFQRQQEVVTQLKKNGYVVKQLAVGWNELRHFQNIWIPEQLWGTIDVNSLIDQN